MTATDQPPAPSADADRPADERTAPRRPGRAWSFLRELVIVVVGALIVSSLLRAFVGQMFVIPSGSMENTLLEQDRVVVQKITHFHRGQVVVFADPGSWIGDSPAEPRGPLGQALEFIGVLPDTSTEHLIKRVIGLPGDHVVCCDVRDRITVNGQPLDERSYLYTAADGTQNAPSDVKFDVVVPAGRLWVMGDHREISADSRCHLGDVSVDAKRGTNAFVPEADVVGPAFGVALPLVRSRLLHVPATFAAVPQPTEPAPATAVINTPDVSC